MFSWWTTCPVAWKSIMKVTNQKVARWPKRFASSKLWLFHDGFHKKQQHFTPSSAPARCFFSTLKSHKVVWTSHWRTMASLEMQFSLVHMHKSLSNETIIIQGCWVRKTRVHEDRESLCHPLLTDRCLNRAWSMILKPILHTSTEEAYENRLAALW